MKHVVYISGPMSGLPNFNYPAFHEKEEELRAQGHEVINPATTGIIDTASLSRSAEWHDYMASAVSRMRDATAIHYLSGWRGSFGARIENLVARKMRLPQI